MVSRDTDVTLLYSATLVSLHLSVVTGSKPFGPDPCPHPALAGRKCTRYLFYLFKPLLMRHSLKDAEIPRTASHAAGPLWTPRTAHPRGGCTPQLAAGPRPLTKALARGAAGAWGPRQLPYGCSSRRRPLTF